MTYVNQAETRKDRMILWGIVASAALVRLAYAILPRLIRWDEAGHLMIARNLITGHGYTVRAGIPDVHLPPVLPLASAALLKLGLTPEWATSAIHIVTGALLCLPVYALGRAIYGRRVGLIAAALVVVYPALAAQPFLWGTMTESPFLLFVFYGIWAIWQALHTDRTRWYAATGLCFGLAYLTRPEGLTYFAVLGLFMAVWHLARKTFWRPATIGRLALAVIVCLAVISPYVIYLHDASGHWTLSGKVGLILDIAPAYVAHDQAAHDLAVSRLDSTGLEVIWFSPERFNRSLSQYVLANPAGFFYQVRQNMAEMWLALFHQTLFSPWIVALAAVGIFARPWSRRRWRDESLLWVALLPLASFWVFFVIDRFLIGALPLGLLWAAAGLAHLAGWANRSMQALLPGTKKTAAATLAALAVHLAAALPLAITLAVCLSLGLGQLEQGLAHMPWSHKEAGQWLATISNPDDIIMTRSTEVGLYAGRQSITSPNATWEELLAYARAHNARYLAVDDWEVTRLRPQFSFLLDPGAAPPVVEYLRTFTHGATTVIYRLRPER